MSLSASNLRGEYFQWDAFAKFALVLLMYKIVHKQYTGINVSNWKKEQTQQISS